MITPFFTISQDDEFIFIEVKISHIRFSATNIEMVVQEELFIFSLSPYYLRLRLPHACVDDERSHAEYDSAAEAVKIRIPKETRGQHFPDLDLTTKLLARLGEQPADAKKLMGAKPLIEELDVDNTGAGTAESAAAEGTAAGAAAAAAGAPRQELVDGEEHSWEISQTMPTGPSGAVVAAVAASDVKLPSGGAPTLDAVDLPTLGGAAAEPSLQGGPHYGFNNTFSGIIGVSVSNGNDINELGDPETTSADDRIVERLIKENIKFDPEYYAADYIMQKYPSPDDDKLFSALIGWRSPTTKAFMKWYKQQQELPAGAPDREQVMPLAFSKDEQEKLLDLPRKTYLVDDPRVVQELLGLLVSLLFAHHFDLRETEGDHNIESAWTVGKLTAQFAFLDSKLIQSGAEEAAASDAAASDAAGAAISASYLRALILTSIRRALSYPLHRNFALVAKVWDDVYYNLRGGKRSVIKSLLEVRELFRYHDVYYVYNKIWLDDLCSWVISDNVSEAAVRALAHDLKKSYTAVGKSDVTFEKLNSEDAAEGGAEGDTEMEDADDIIALNLQEIEEMAEHSFREYQNQ